MARKTRSVARPKGTATTKAPHASRRTPFPSSHYTHASFHTNANAKGNHSNSDNNDSKGAANDDGNDNGNDWKDCVECALRRGLFLPPGVDVDIDTDLNDRG